MSLLLQRQGCSLHVTFELSGRDCDGQHLSVICCPLSSHFTIKLSLVTNHHHHQPTLYNSSLVTSEANTPANSLNNNIKVIPTFD